jgi:hypothetical protein
VGHDQHPTVQVVDRSLRQIRFEPRPSLEAELLWRLRRGGDGQVDDLDGISGGALVALAALAVGVLVFLFWVKLLTIAPGSG